MPRYVVLYHQTPPGYQRPPHWDLMLEADDALKTWALESPPAPGEATCAELLPDHRTAFLDYEGPVSGGRGCVARWDAGEFDWQCRNEGDIRIQVTGERLLGVIRLVVQRLRRERWLLTYDPRSTGTVSPAK